LYAFFKLKRPPRHLILNLPYPSQDIQTQLEDLITAAATTTQSSPLVEQDLRKRKRMAEFRMSQSTSLLEHLVAEQKAWQEVSSNSTTATDIAELKYGNCVLATNRAREKFLSSEVGFLYNIHFLTSLCRLESLCFDICHVSSGHRSWNEPQTLRPIPI
jgi:hypothetical protein